MIHYSYLSKVCLFDGKEVSLRDKLRAGASDEQLLQTIQAALMGKKARHGGMEKLQANVMENRAMINIGLSNLHLLCIAF